MTHLSLLPGQTIWYSNPKHRSTHPAEVVRGPINRFNNCRFWEVRKAGKLMTIAEAWIKLGEERRRQGEGKG